MKSFRNYQEKIVSKRDASAYYQIALKGSILTLKQFCNGTFTDIFSMPNASGIARHICQSFNYDDIDNIVKCSSDAEIIGATFELSYKLTKNQNIAKADIKVFATGNAIVAKYVLTLLDKIDKVKVTYKRANEGVNVYEIRYIDRVLGECQVKERR